MNSCCYSCQRPRSYNERFDVRKKHYIPHLIITSSAINQPMAPVPLLAVHTHSGQGAFVVAPAHQVGCRVKDVVEERRAAARRAVARRERRASVAEMTAMKRTLLTSLMPCRTLRCRALSSKSPPLCDACVADMFPRWSTGTAGRLQPRLQRSRTKRSTRTAYVAPTGQMPETKREVDTWAMAVLCAGFQ